MKLFAVKVQIDDTGQRMLVYDKTREHFFEGPLSSDVRRWMNGKRKAFFAAFMSDPIDGEPRIILDYPTPDQDW